MEDLMGVVLKIVMKPINWVCSFIFGVIAFLILLVGVLAWTFNFWIPRVAPVFFRGYGDFAFHMARSESNLFTMNFNFYDIAVRNGSSFPIPDFVYVEQFSADVILRSLFTKHVTVENFVVDIPRLTYVKCADGRDNLSEFLRVLSGKSAEKGKAGKNKEFFFRHVEFSFGKVTLVDFAARAERTREIILNYHFSADDVMLHDLVARVGADLKARGAYFLMQAIFGPLNRIPGFANIIGAIPAAGEFATDTLERGLDVGKNFLRKVREILQ
jgi:hypothetical protein